MISAEPQIFPCAEDRVGQDAGRVMPVGFPVVFHRVDQRGTFVERVPAKILDPEILLKNRIIFFDTSSRT